jgi:hypothetical protein
MVISQDIHTNLSAIDHESGLAMETITKEACSANVGRESTHTEQLFFHVNDRQLYALRAWKLIEKLPSISREEIERKSRGDVLVKATAVAQVLWMVIQIVVRGAQQLPTSQLEIAVLAFSTCAFITYSFSWFKPQDVREATVIGSVDCLTSRQLETLQNASGHSLFRHMLGFVFKKYHANDRVRFGPIANDTTHRDLEIRLPLGAEGYVYYNFVGTGILLASMIFGAVHCIAWNFEFPTLIEAQLWRVASVVSTCILILHPLVQTMQALLFAFIPILDRVASIRAVIEFGCTASTFFVIAGYAVARLFLMVEIFRSLLFLPPGAFVSTWPSYIPHIG